MDNLEVYSHIIKYDSELLENVLKSSIGDSVVCFITQNKQVCIADGLHSIKTIEITEDIVDDIVDLKYINFWHYIVIVTQSKFIVIDPKESKSTILQSPTKKLIHASWNPNETCLVAIDEDEKLHSFSFGVTNADLQQYQFIPLKQTPLNGPVPNSVYIGWGSHNTQFKGIKKVEENITEHPQDYCNPLISWRGNGEQFVINFWKESRRLLKVFDSNLNPLNESEVYPNLLPPISFKGQGNFIACAAEYPDGNKIVIFEKNCLVKSEFLAKHIKGKIRSLQYHPELHILAIYSEYEQSGFLSIYLYSNGHWYLKQHLYYPQQKHLISFYWGTIYDKNSCYLNVLTSIGIEQLFLKLVFNRSIKRGLIATIDGNMVSFTNLFKEIIPPPMSSFILSFNEAVNKVNFNDESNIDSFTLSNNIIKNFSYNNGKFEEFLEELDIPIASDLEDTSIFSARITNNNFLYTISLTRNGDLVINDTTLCTNVLSMIVVDIYLLFTHYSCRLYCLRLTSENLGLTKWDLNNFYFREVEQGSKIVSVTASSEVVLILPRGNLETVTCRLISIDVINKLLAENNWVTAIEEIRRQRLNWNLLIDLDPIRFCNSLDDFVEAANTFLTLNSIVSEFTLENSLITVYPQCIDDKVSSSTDKEQVILKILQKLVLLNPVSNLTSIVTLQVQQFSLNSGLNSVHQVFKMGETDECRDAVDQILMFHHPFEIIDEAFTLYDLDFMMFIYSCCSEDPKVFEPEIENLKSIDDPIQLRFKMNELAKHFDAATKYLLRCKSYDEKFLSSFITKHTTQRAAYETLCSKHSHFKLVSELFANFLSLRSRHNEAGMVLERAGLFEKALSHYQRALNWKYALTLFEKLKLNEKSRKDILLNIAQTLVSEKRIEEAATLYEYHCGENEIAIKVLTEAHMVQQALALSRKYGNIEIEENLVVPKIKQYRAELLEKIEDLGAKFSKYSLRLEVLRQTKINKLKFNDFEDNEPLGIDDINSEYGSIISRGSTLKSTTSSEGSTLSVKLLRKLEKKKMDTRKGGIYEDIALIRQLYLLIVDIFVCGDEVKEVCSTLTDDTSFKYAKLLHDKLIDIQGLVTIDIPKIWCNEFVNELESSDPHILAIIQNREELDNQFRTPPPIEKVSCDWKMLIFCEH